MKRIPANDPRLQWMGRTAPSPAGIRLGCPGVTLNIAARTTKLAIALDASTPDCAFDVSVDDESWKRLQPMQGASEFIVAEELAGDRPHFFRIVRRNDPWEGVVEIREIVLPDDGEILDPPNLPRKKLLFVGDSITAGSANECLPPQYPKAPAGTNANRAFGMELARRLNAQVHLVAYGGRGITRDWLGRGDDLTSNARVFFERSMPDEAWSTWDHEKYQPDVIVVGFGANDFNPGIPDEEIWTDAYDGLLKRLRSVHPAAKIIITNSAAISSKKENGDFAKAAALEHYLDEIVAKAGKRWDVNVEKVLLRYQPGTEKDSHPTVPQHLLIADDLEPAIRRLLDQTK